jgi:excisionase family DNA binding protein
MTADVMRTLILRKMDECDELADRPDLPCPDPRPNARRGSEIVQEVGNRMARLGFAELYELGQEYVPFAHPDEAKGYLARCLAVLPQPATVESPYLDSEKAAQYLGIDVKQLYRQVELGKLKPLRGPRNSYRFTKQQLDNYLGK